METVAPVNTSNPPTLKPCVSVPSTRTPCTRPWLSSTLGSSYKNTLICSLRICSWKSQSLGMYPFWLFLSEIEELKVCDNVGDHLIGSKFPLSNLSRCVLSIRKRGRRSKGHWFPKHSVLRGQALARRVVPRHGFQGVLLSPVRYGRMQSRWVL